MKEHLRVHYLEIVTQNVELACTLYSKTLNVSFGDAVPELGDARTATLADGGLVGIRAPMHEAEEPATRPYYLVSDIDKAVAETKDAGAEIAVPPMEIPGRGYCAIIFHNSNQSGFWQIPS